MGGAAPTHVGVPLLFLNQCFLWPIDTYVIMYIHKKQVRLWHVMNSLASFPGRFWERGYI